MKALGRALGLVLALSLADAAPARSATAPADPARIVRAGLVSHGVPACASCHGMAGEGAPAQNGPRLAGLDEDYLDSQLEAFASGARHSAAMGPISKALSAQQRAQLAGYFAALPPRLQAGAVDARHAARGRILALSGDWSRGVPACAACHGPNGEGVGSLTPPLAGQTQDYLARQLTAFRNGDRTGPLGLMSGVAKRLPMADLKAAAAYYAALPAPPPVPRSQRN